MKLIETSCMIVCIDQPLPAELFNRRESPPGKIDAAGAAAEAAADAAGRRDDTNRAVQMINGGGTQFNSANRWYDKSVQVHTSSSIIMNNNNSNN